MTSLEYYIEVIEQFISMLTDDIESGEGTVVTQTKLAVYREVLEHLEEIEQEPSNDMVSRRVFEQVMWERDVAIEQLKDLGYGLGEKPRTGHWKHNKCDVCGASRPPLFDNYCPNCGAKMVEPQERSGEK